MLIDTSGWLCALHKDEREHEKAVRFYTEASVRITHSYILAEFVPLAEARKFPRQSNLLFTRRILDDEEVKLVWVDEDLHRKAVPLLVKREDKTYSLCDAVSFIVMRNFGIAEALTTDKHFKQEGFVRLLVP